MGRPCEQRDHRYQPGAYDVCRRCGGDKPKAVTSQIAIDPQTFQPVKQVSVEGLVEDAARIIDPEAFSADDHRREHQGDAVASPLLVRQLDAARIKARAVLILAERTRGELERTP